jgi:hypothetical protein
MMNFPGYDKIELLLEMARYFGSRFEKPVPNEWALSTERKCWIKVYRFLKEIREFDLMIDFETECEYESTADIASAELVYPYLESEIQCMRELWYLYMHYQKMIKEKQFVRTKDTAKRDGYILELILKKRWIRAEFVSARALIERAILSHLFLPRIFSKSSELTNPDDCPF